MENLGSAMTIYILETEARAYRCQLEELTVSDLLRLTGVDVVILQPVGSGRAIPANPPLSVPGRVVPKAESPSSKKAATPSETPSKKAERTARLQAQGDRIEVWSQAFGTDRVSGKNLLDLWKQHGLISPGAHECHVGSVITWIQQTHAKGLNGYQIQRIGRPHPGKKDRQLWLYQLINLNEERSSDEAGDPVEPPPPAIDERPFDPRAFNPGHLPFTPMTLLDWMWQLAIHSGLPSEGTGWLTAQEMAMALQALGWKADLPVEKVYNAVPNAFRGNASKWSWMHWRSHAGTYRRYRLAAPAS